MTTPDGSTAHSGDNSDATGAEVEDVVASPATPGARALPLPDDEVDKPSETSEQ